MFSDAISWVQLRVASADQTFTITPASGYVLDEIFIVGHVPGFETLNDAVLAWMREEI